jgi:hypothetical protein
LCPVKHTHDELPRRFDFGLDRAFFVYLWDKTKLPFVKEVMQVGSQ